MEPQKKQITKEMVDHLTQKSGTSFLWDGGDGSCKGFGVRITPAGVKSYVYQYRIGGRGSAVRRYTIGRHGETTPAKARARARELAEQVRRGIDPIDAKREAVTIKAESKAQERELAFDAYCARYVELRVKPEGLASLENIEAIFRRHAIPILKSKPLPKITKRDMVAVLDGIPASSAALRRSTYAILHKMFNWAKSRDDIAVNPMDGMKAPPAVASRDRVLSDSELALALRAAAQMDAPFGPLYQLLFATGQRRDECAALDWSELDRENALWTLPAARAKNGEANLVPLNAPALAVLDRMAGAGLSDSALWPRKGLVFTTTGKTPVSGYSRAKARLDAIMEAIARQDTIDAGQGHESITLAPWRLHDARRTLATGLQRLGVRFEVTEAVLNHTSGAKSGVAGVYQRHGWGPEKRAALDAWAAHCERLLNPADDGGNVVPMRRSDSL